MSQTFPADRIQLPEVAPEQFAAMYRLQASIDFDRRLGDLIRVRASRAALELRDAMTLVADGQVPDEVWNRASAAFGEDELAQLVFAITAINAWNRLIITARVEPGHYEPSLREAA